MPARLRNITRWGFERYPISFRGLLRFCAECGRGRSIPRTVHLQDDIQQRQRFSHIAISIDSARAGFIDGVERGAFARKTCRVRVSAPRAVAPAHLPLLSQLLRDFLPIKSHIRVQSAHKALVLGFQRIVADTLDVKIPSGTFDCEIAKPLPCRDEGVALLGSHYPLLTLLLKA